MENKKEKTKVLWIAPNLNHYKARLLNRLADRGKIALTVFSGKTPQHLGHRGLTGRNRFSEVKVQETKNRFQWNPLVYTKLAKVILRANTRVILMPYENKFVFLIFFVFCLKLFVHFRLVSYNHPVGRGNGSSEALQRVITKLLFGMYDRIVFYTKEGFERTVKEGMVAVGKASYANNTLDTLDIWREYSLEVNRSSQKVILFIGRLVRNKRLDLLIDYYGRIAEMLPGTRLVVIGSGPEASSLGAVVVNNRGIKLVGAVVDESEIAKYMRMAHLILVPGWSGLSIVHAFCYGKPYATIKGPHPPEIEYIKDGRNGLVLSGNIGEDCKRIVEFLTDPISYERVCIAAFEKAKELSVENWCKQIEQTLCQW